MKKVLIITYYWPPSGGAGVQRSLKFVKYLSESGIDPVVLTVDDKHASYPVKDESLIDEVPKGILVIKTKSFEALKILSLFTSKKNIPHGGFANTGKESVFQKLLRFIRGNFFIPDARIGWVKHALPKASELIEQEKIETVFISSPPHSSQLIGLQLKNRFPSLKWVADLRDPWTDIYYYKDLLHTKSAAGKDASYELKVLQQADHIISVSESIRKIFTGKSPDLNPGKFHVLPNGYDESDFTRVVYPEKDKFVITYVGSMAEVYRPDIFFSVLHSLMEKYEDVNTTLRMVGTHAASARTVIENNQLSGITEFIPPVSHSIAVSYMQQSTVLFLAIPDTVNNEGILTGKLFEYLASRRPIIGLGPVHGDAAKILDDCNAGKMFERNQKDALFAYLESLMIKWKNGEDLSNQNNEYQKFSRRNLTRQLASYL